MSKVEKSSEPSMDEILNSIRKIIADGSTGSRPPQPTSAVPLPPPGNATFNTSGMAAAPPPPPPSRTVRPQAASAVDDVLDDFARAAPAPRAAPPAPAPGHVDPNAPSWLTLRTPSTMAAEKLAAPAPVSPPPHLTVKPFFGQPARDAPAAQAPTTVAPAAAAPDRPASGNLGAFVPTRPEAQSPPPSLPDFVLPPERRAVGSPGVDINPPVIGRSDQPASSQTVHATPPASSPTPPIDRLPPAGQPDATVPDPAAIHRTGEPVPLTQVFASPSARQETNGAVGVGAEAAKPSAPPSGPPATRTPSTATDGPVGARNASTSPQSNNGAARDDMVITGPPMAPHRPPATPATNPSIPSATPGSAPAAQISARVSPTPPTQASVAQHVAPASRPVVASPGAPVRTMEDTVVELLRPMLRQWLDANMPRIVEKALRVELSEDGKKKH